MKQIKTFISYAHRDGEYFKDFTEKFNVAIQNRKQFEWQIWSDKDIYLGTFWDEAIQKNIHDCNVALLLVSMGFMSSQYIREQEFEAFKSRYADKGVLIIPVLFAPCDFDNWEDLAEIQFFKPQGTDYGCPDKKKILLILTLLILRKTVLYFLIPMQIGMF